MNVDKNIEGIEKLSRIGGTVKFTGGAGYIPLPPDYINKGFRYIDYPFFNPIPETKDNPADHYIAESDMIVSNGCSAKDLVRLTNSLSHASERADIILLINNIEKRIGDVILWNVVPALSCVVSRSLVSAALKSDCICF